MTKNENQRSGFIAMIGRPNVGKSTLLNKILGTKISITSKKPQTTRHRILGVKTDAATQAIYVDTPGLHQHAAKALNKRMNKIAKGALVDVDVVVFLCDARGVHDTDLWILSILENISAPVILVLNKIDKLKDKETLLPLIAQLEQHKDFAAIIPLSAKHADGVPQLETTLAGLLPVSPHFFQDGEITDRPTQFLLAEIFREKLMRNLGQELPFATTVVIEQFKEKDKLIDIHALIWVEKESQKIIILGKKGEKLKQIATAARLDMEKLLNKRVMLNSWIKVKDAWTNDDAALNAFGYDPNK